MVEANDLYPPYNPAPEGGEKEERQQRRNVYCLILPPNSTERFIESIAIVKAMWRADDSSKAASLKILTTRS